MPANYKTPISTMRLSPGLRTALTQFERAVRDHDRLLNNPRDIFDKEDALEIDKRFQYHKQTLLRKLYRVQTGGGFVDTEAMKKDLRTMCRVIRNIQLAPQQAAEILHTAKSTLAIVQGVIDHQRPL